MDVKNYLKLKTYLNTEIINQLNLIQFRKINKLIKVKIDLDILSSEAQKKLVKELGLKFHSRFIYLHTSKELVEKPNYIISKFPGIYKHYSFLNDDIDENDLQAIDYEGNIQIFRYLDSVSSLSNIKNEKYFNVINVLLRKKDTIIFQDNNFRTIKIYEKL